MELLSKFYLRFLWTFLPGLLSEYCFRCWCCGVSDFFLLIFLILAPEIFSAVPFVISAGIFPDISYGVHPVVSFGAFCRLFLVGVQRFFLLLRS